jgi:hypothetical protein
MAAANTDFLILILQFAHLKNARLVRFVPGEIQVGEWNFFAASKIACGPCLPPPPQRAPFVQRGQCGGARFHRQFGGLAIKELLGGCVAFTKPHSEAHKLRVPSAWGAIERKEYHVAARALAGRQLRQCGTGGKFAFHEGQHGGCWLDAKGKVGRDVTVEQGYQAA